MTFQSRHDVVRDTALLQKGREGFPERIARGRHCVPRTVSAQFMDGGVIVMFELTFDGDDVSIVREKHYRLVGASDITPADLGVYKLPD